MMRAKGDPLSDARGKLERRIERDVPLAARTTFELGGPAQWFLAARSEAELIEALRWAAAARVPVTVLGGGSNVVVADEGVAGLTLHVATRGVSYADGVITAQAGEPWDGVAAGSVARGWAGLECLSGIPGRVGATPIQNVGAYGQEVAETIASVRVLDRETLAVCELDNAQCEFGYRDSRFKRSPGRYVVTAVRYELRPGGRPQIRYPELERKLSQATTPVTLELARNSVLALRRSKSMVIDQRDDNRRSAGSFFVNPIVDDAVAEAIVEQALREGLVKAAPAVPRYPAGQGRTKLAAGWLVEQSGWPRGSRAGAFGLSSKHALALVHHGGGTAEDLIVLARAVRDAVLRRFGVRLAPEPVFLGFPDGFVF